MSPMIHTTMNIGWLILIFLWLVSSLSAKKSSQRESLFLRFIYYWLPLILEIYLLGPEERPGNSLIKGNFIPHINQVGLTGLFVFYLGLIIAFWSRILLGKNWSVSVQRKKHHELIKKGPYSLVRHPIYTGLLLMFLGNTIIESTWRGLIGFLILFVSFWFKLRKEEKWLTGIFGNDYLQYMTTTKALIPWIL
jgi:protein-S-isoprenylcysteine O-methyltransferase Ste14